MGDPQVTPVQLEEIRRGMRLLSLLVKRLPKMKRTKTSVKNLKDLKILKVYIYEQKVPKDGHGPVVIIAESRGLADMQFLNEYQRLWPKSSAVNARAHLKNAQVTVKPCVPSIVLNVHGF